MVAAKPDLVARSKNARRGPLGAQEPNGGIDAGNENSRMEIAFLRQRYSRPAPQDHLHLSCEGTA